MKILSISDKGITKANTKEDIKSFLDFQNKADLVGGKVATSQVPAVAIVDYLGNVQNEAEMLNLVGQKGDWCTRSDTKYAYFIVGENPSLISSWQKIIAPASPVQSVNNQTGNVVLSKLDIGLENVPNIDYGPVKMDKPTGSPNQYIAADGSYKDFLADQNDIGIFNPANSTATIGSINTILSSVPPASWQNGQSVTVSSQGNISFSGINFNSGTSVAIGDKIRKRDNIWELLKLSTNNALLPSYAKKIETTISDNEKFNTVFQQFFIDWSTYDSSLGNNSVKNTFRYNFCLCNFCTT